MSSRYTDDKRTHHHHNRDDLKDRSSDRHRNHYEHKQKSRSRTRSRSRSRSRSPDYRSKYSSGSSSSSYSRSNHHREMNSGRNGVSSIYGRNDEHKSRDADDLVCPPPPVISKVSMSFGKQHAPKPVQLKLSANKKEEPVKKITVASAFSNNDSDDDDEEEPPVKYSRNIGRDTPTSSGPNSFGKTKQGFCDVKKIFEKSLREYSNE